MLVNLNGLTAFSLITFSRAFRLVPAQSFLLSGCFNFY